MVYAKKLRNQPIRIIKVIAKRSLDVPIVKIMSRLYFGNNAGLWNNYKGRRTLRNSDYVSGKQTTKQLLADGFVLLEETFHENPLVRQIADIYLDEISQIEAVTTKPKVVYVVPLLEKIPQIKELFNSKLESIFDDYFGSKKWLIADVTAWRNYYWEVPTSEDVNSDLWHNDESPTDTLKLFIILSNGVNEKNGATRILSIRDTKSVMRLGYFSRNRMLKSARKFIDNKAKVYFMSGDLGRSFIFNPQVCLHSAGRVKRGSIRDVLCITVASSKKPSNLIENLKVLSRDQSRRVREGKSISWR
jgi:hypothetical protein